MRIDDVYEELLNITSGFGVDVDVPSESRKFFEEVVSNFTGTQDQLLLYVEAKMPEWFHCLSERPNWLQNSEWQYSDGVPMIFIGQIDVPVESNLFHDQARFFIFWHPKWDETKTVIQVS